MFWSKVRKIKALKHTEYTLRQRIKELEESNTKHSNRLGNAYNTLKAENEDKIKKLSSELSDSKQDIKTWSKRWRTLADTSEAQLREIIRLNTALKQTRNAHVSYKKDLASLNIKIETQKASIEGVLNSETKSTK